MPAQNPRGGGCFDGLFALLMAVADLAALVVTGLMLGLRGWAQSSRGGEHASTPPMDWTPVVWFGVVFAVMVLLAYACWTGGLRITGGTQAAFALIAGVLLCVALVQEYGRSHPDPPAPSPTAPYSDGHGPCRSGGDSHECLGG